MHGVLAHTPALCRKQKRRTDGKSNATMLAVTSWESVAQAIPATGVAAVAIGFVLDSPRPSDESWRGFWATGVGRARPPVTPRIIPPLFAERQLGGRVLPRPKRPDKI